MDKRTILAFVLIALVIILWDDYLRWFGLAPEPEDVDTTSVAVETVRPARSSDTHQTPPVIKSIPGESDLEAQPAVSALDIHTRQFDFQERFVTVETESFRAKLTTDGARLVSYILKPTRTYLKHEIQLIPENGRARSGFRFWTYDGPVDTDKLKYRLDDGGIEGDMFVKLSFDQKKTVEFVTSIGEDAKLRIIYTFTNDGYTFLYDVKTIGLGDTWVRPDAEAFWQGGLAFTEPDTGQDVFYSKAYVYYTGDVLEKFKINTKKDVIEGPATGTTRWGAIRTKYFMAAIIPENAPAEGAWMESKFDSLYIGKYHPNWLGVGLMIPIVKGAPATPVRVYIGPLDDTILSAVDPSLKQAMTWGAGIPFVDGIVKPISKVVLWGLKALHGFVPNYGICIIIFSVLVKIIIWPLTRKSYQSMAAMQKLQPKLKALREKHKDDPQLVQKKIMQLYKEEKVNPMGGCLPMLLQMPLLYALFIVFRATIEFRRAPFVLWINDLSLPDVIFHLPFSLPLYGDHVALLPIIMGISSYFQSKTTMTDPNQKMMLYFMPIFLTLIFNQFPSGLTMYYTLFNIWTLVQQKITPPPAVAPVETNKLPKKK